MSAIQRFSTEDHWKHFADFCRLEMASGGPDPQIPLVGVMSNGQSWEDHVWWGGCYIAVYNVPFAEVLWSEWSWERVQAEGSRLETWLKYNWSWIVTRIERRCVRRPAWMAEFLLGYRDMVLGLPKQLEQWGGVDSHVRYNHLWDYSLTVPRLGRYVALKLLEYYRRYCDIDASAPDIRPKDAWSPRRTLSILFPENADQLNGGNDESTLQLVNRTVDQLLVRLGDFGVHPSIFDAQVMLCEYRESYEGKRQYPGRSIDSELSYAHKAHHCTEGKYPTKVFWSARDELFPLVHLGEHNGWTGPRKELGIVLSQYGYTWSDLLYDYTQTSGFGGNIARPVRRED